MIVQNSITDCCVIGSGLSGLMVARTLKDRNMNVIVLDKGRGAGGRMATRRVPWNRSYAVFDYGAQYLTVRDALFRDFIEELVKNDVVRLWSRGFYDNNRDLKIDGVERFIGVEGMRSITRYLSRDLDLRQSERVEYISSEKGQWLIRTNTDKCFRSEIVVLTPPVQQSLALLVDSGIELDINIHNKLSEISYDPCIALLAFCNGGSSIPDPGGIWCSDKLVDWIADNRKKGISEQVTAITVHTTSDFSRNFWDRSDEEIITEVSGYVGDMLGVVIADCQVHKWRYSRPVKLFDRPFARIDSPGTLYFTGDAFVAPRIEGAFISGIKTARDILSE